MWSLGNRDLSIHADGPSEDNPIVNRMHALRQRSLLKMQQYHRAQAGESKITRAVQPPVLHSTFRQEFLHLVCGWQSDSEPELCKRIIRASNWGFRRGGLLPDEIAVVSMMINHVTKD